MKNQFPFTTQPGAGARPISFEQAALIFTPEEIESGEKRGDLKTVGMWQIPVSYKALAVSQDFSGQYHEYAGRALTVYGVRTLSNVRQSGYEIEGRVSVNGKSHRGFSSSTLFELPNGKLINCAVIHVCGMHEVKA